MGCCVRRGGGIGGGVWYCEPEPHKSTSQNDASSLALCESCDRPFVIGTATAAIVCVTINGDEISLELIVASPMVGSRPATSAGSLVDALSSYEYEMERVHILRDNFEFCECFGSCTCVLSDRKRNWRRRANASARPRQDMPNGRNEIKPLDRFVVAVFAFVVLADVAGLSVLLIYRWNSGWEHIHLVAKWPKGQGERWGVWDLSETEIYIATLSTILCTRSDRK